MGFPAPDPSVDHSPEIAVLMKEFCEATGLSRDTVRFYVKRGLLNPSIGARSGQPARPQNRPPIRGRSLPPTNRYQVFDDGQVERARLIRAAQGLGFTLAEIAELASAYEKGALTRTEKMEVLRTHLAALEERAERLQAVRRYLRAKLEWVEGGERGAGPTVPVQPPVPASSGSSPG